MNYYEILEVSQNASQEVIRAAYKSLMQRNHPDKYPGDMGVTSRAALISQAYEVLSDSVQRAAYNLKIKDQAELIQASPRPNHADRATRGSRPYTGRPAAKSSFSWYPWLVISVILVCAWLIFSLSSKKQVPEPTLADLRPPPDMAQSAQASRTTPLFSTPLTVSLKGPGQSAGGNSSSLANPERVLSIPVLIVKIGSFDSEKFLRYIAGKRDVISLQLAEKLASARYEELVKAGGEEYLKKTVLDSLGEIAGTNRFEDYPAAAGESPGRYGVIEVFLPESFSLR
jgi:hypothetical protein